MAMAPLILCLQVSSRIMYILIEFFEPAAGALFWFYMSIKFSAGAYACYSVLKMEKMVQ